MADGASKIGARFGLTPMIIGLTIVAAGTSAPELAVVSQSIIADDTELAVGSIVGSNIANVLLVLGLAVTFGAIHVTSRVVRVDIPIMIASSVLVLVMSLDGKLTRPEGIVLFAGVIAFVIWTLRVAPRESASGDGSGTRQADVPASESPSLVLQATVLVVGIATLGVAARFVVSGAEGIALLGATTSFAPDGIAIGDDVVRLDLPIMVAAAVACLPIVFWDHKLDRWEGIVFVAYYFAYVTFLALHATGHRASDPFALVLTVFVMPLTVLTVAIGIVRQRRVTRVGSVDQITPA